MNQSVTYILSAEWVGDAKVDEDGILDIGGIKVRVDHFDGWREGSVGVYVRRQSSDLSVMEIALAGHDGLAQEELDAQNEEADRYPLGPKEYWRSKMVGKYTYGYPDTHPMTNEEFEAEWPEEE